MYTDFLFNVVGDLHDSHPVPWPIDTDGQSINAVTGAAVLTAHCDMMVADPFHFHMADVMHQLGRPVWFYLNVYRVWTAPAAWWWPVAAPRLPVYQCVFYMPCSHCTCYLLFLYIFGGVTWCMYMSELTNQ